METSFYCYIMNNFIATSLLKLAFMYFICIISHYASSHLYTTYCVEASWTGFIMSPLLTMSPHCQALRWVIYNGGYNINIMWFIIGNWCINRLRKTDVQVFGEKNTIYKKKTVTSNQKRIKQEKLEFVEQHEEEEEDDDDVLEEDDVLEGDDREE